MQTHFLRFDTEAAFTTALADAGFTTLLSHTHIFDVIGPITQVTSYLAIADDQRCITIADGFVVALNDDHTSWVYQFTPPAELQLDPGETLTVTLSISYSNQNTGDNDNATIEITASDDGYLIEQLILDPEDADVVLDRQPLTNTTDAPGLPYDAWHVNAKLLQLPTGWDTYVVTPGSPVRIFAGD
jgi:hypothetical protein